MPSSLHERACTVAIEAAHQAARIIRHYASQRETLDVSEKNTHDIVTRADVEAQQSIIDHLTKAFADHTILAEEGDLNQGDEANEGYRWVIDPLDGTTNFTHGVPPYAVSIGLQEDDRVVVGVVLDVARDELFTAIRGQGLYVNGNRVRVSSRSALGESLLTTGFPYRAFDYVDAYLEVMRAAMEKAQGLRRPGAASVDFAYVACGRFDGFFEIELSPWDVAAGSLLVEEGGGRVTDFSDTPSPLFARQVLATNGHIHHDLLSLLEPLRRSQARG
jgi:myo-inositol-1(or 4)-monophosphatase